MKWKAISRRKGELPIGVPLELASQYVDMEGSGELWVNTDGLPVRQVITLKFPPERHGDEWVEATLTTNFSAGGHCPRPCSSISPRPQRLWTEPAIRFCCATDGG
ncbi:MAG: hypothetical protein R2867_27985 [Caldilineaceae bacterium]